MHLAPYTCIFHRSIYSSYTVYLFISRLIAAVCGSPSTLCEASEGGPFNRLILQSENGGDWEGDDEGADADADGLMDVDGHDSSAQACWELYCRDTAISTPERVRGVASEMIYPKWCPQLADK